LLLLLCSTLWIGPDAAHADDSGLDHPEALERANARASLGPQVRDFARERLASDSPAPAAVVEDIATLAASREPDDIALILRHADSLEPAVTQAVAEAMRAFGVAALSAIEAHEGLPAAVQDELRRLISVEHILSCGRRDRSVNPLGLAYGARFAELDSVEFDLKPMVFEMLLQVVELLREDVAVQRPSITSAADMRWRILQEGGLAVAAVGERYPEELLGVIEEFFGVDGPQDMFGYGSGEFQPLTLQIAVFLASRGHGELLHHVLETMQSRQRFGRAPDRGWRTLRMAAYEYSARGDGDGVRRRLQEAQETLVVGTSDYAGWGHYMRARLQMARGDHSLAVRALEDAMEVGDSPPLLVLVDDAFEPLRAERRFGTILDFAQLAQRRQPQQQRPWQPDA
jgi:hypothetical protein